MKRSLITAFCGLLHFLPLAASEPGVYEMPKTQVVPIKDSQTDGQYELYIKLPDGYEQDKKVKYPVIYYTDAVWHIELLSAATAYLMEDVILVGISWQTDISQALQQESGAHVSRFRDYSTERSTNLERQAKYQFGQASAHLTFIQNDVIKFIETNFRTQPKNRTYFGYSLGGEFGAYILLAHTNTFKNYILGSPSLRGNIPFLSKLSSDLSLKRKNLNTNVFISYGSLEHELGSHVEEFIALLKSRKDDSLKLNRFISEGNHSQAFPLTGVSGITWLSSLNTKDTEL